MIEKYVNAEELKRLVSTLVAILGCLLVAGLFASIVVPGLRNANQPPSPTAIAPVVGESGWLDPTEYPPQKGQEIPPVDPDSLMHPTPALIARGKSLFENNCTSCHGALGRGDGPAAGTMNPRPRNLSGPEGWVNGYHAPGIFKTLSEGIANSSMASFDYLQKKDRMALVHYVQLLGAFAHDTAPPKLMEGLAATLGSAGERTPNVIPVSMAMRKLREESPTTPRLFIDRDDQSPGSILLRKVIMDASRASQFLAASTTWRMGYRDLAASVVAEIPGNGFSTDSVSLKTADWQRLYAELIRRTKLQ
jgi:mono/diheme cytochrome c family protein